MEQDIWISPQASRESLGTGRVAGLGSYDRPFWGDFDAVRGSALPHTSLHLLPGRFFTYGTRSTSRSSLKTGQHLSGAGMTHTHLVQVDTRRDSSTEVLYSDRDTHWVSVSDLSIDCAGDAELKVKRVAVALKGSYCSIRRVHVINASGSWDANRENFTLYVGNPGRWANLIEGCRVEQFAGDYINGVCCGGGEAIIQHNTVQFEDWAPDAQGHAVGVNLMNANGVVVRGNSVRGGTAGVYNDTGPVESVNVSHNIFRNTWTGAKFNSDHAVLDGLTLEGNTIDLHPQNNWDIGHHGTGVSIWNQNKPGAPPWQNIRLTANLVRTAGNRPGTVRFCQAVGVVPGSIQGILVSHNIAEPQAMVRWKNATGINIKDNFTLAGRPMPWAA